MMDFNKSIFLAGLNDINGIGCLHTWTNKLETGIKVSSKLDRALANYSLTQNFCNTSAEFPPAGVSDHALLIVTVFHSAKIKKSFSFLKCWVQSPLYDDIIAKGWACRYYGTPMHIMFSKLKALKKELITLHKDHFSNLNIRVQNARSALINCQVALQENPLSAGLLAREKLLLDELCALNKDELSSLHQRAKEHSLKLDDCCSEYVFARVTERMAQQNIGVIEDQNGRIHFGLNNVAKAFVDY
ncbi:uncharacterized protein LOC141630710 [Silene latifolia]|uniref:uncharacterized protein LOC141630710 n=1 Tax=Silene latifolia TaxID=37657 RepID=UPI003D775FC7